jgi:hypothetical protein
MECRGAPLDDGREGVAEIALDLTSRAKAAAPRPANGLRVPKRLGQLQSVP